jgi:hypothetical protein
MNGKQKRLVTLTEENVEAALWKCDGILNDVGKAFGVTRQAVSKFLKDRPALYAIAAEAREAMKDDAEKSLHKAVRKGDIKATTFYLETQGKDRGYTKRTEMDITAAVTIEVSDDDREAIRSRLYSELRGGCAIPVGEEANHGGGFAVGESGNGHDPERNGRGPVAE